MAMDKKKDESIEKAHKAKFAALKPPKRAARAAGVIEEDKEKDGDKKDDEDEKPKKKSKKKEEPEKKPEPTKAPEKNPKLKVVHPDPKGKG